MGTISSSVGLISGINSAEIIDQLIAIESRPRQLVEEQNTQLTAQQTAYQTVSAQLLGLQSAASDLALITTFNQKQAVSSNESVVAVTAGQGAAVGDYQFTVSQLVSAQRVVSKGFADTNANAIGATTLTFDRAESRLDRQTRLNTLNGGDGVDLGRLRVTDRSGNTTVVDLSTAVTVDDVLDAFNGSLGVNIIASIDGDNLVLTDNTGSTAQDLVVSNLGSDTTAADLGLVGSSAGTDTLAGTQINSLGDNTQLALLNDGNGVYAAGSNDFSITDGAANAFSISVDGLTTLGQLIDEINDAAATAGSGVVASVASDGVSLQLEDTAATGTLTVAALNGSTAAADLGIEGSDATGTIDGSRIVAAINSTLLKNLNGGTGVAGDINTAGLNELTLLADLNAGAGVTTSGDSTADLTFTLADNTTVDLDLDAFTTVGDFLQGVRAASEGSLTAAIDGNTVVFTDQTALTSQRIATTITGSNVTEDTTISTLASDAGIALSGDATAEISLTLADNSTIDIDLDAYTDVDDLIDNIGGDSNGDLSAVLVGDTLRILDLTTAGSALTAAGTAAADLGLDTLSSTSGSGATADLAAATQTLSLGTITITDTAGTATAIDLSAAESFSDILDLINASGSLVTASLNAAGDGLLLTDNANGTGDLTVADTTGTAAQALRIAGTYDDDTADSGSLQLAYFTLSTSLDDFGVSRGTFRITDSDGASATVDLTQGNELTIGDVIDEINSRGLAINARINDTGDGLIIEDTGSGSARLRIEDEGGTTAADLNIDGQAATFGGSIDGSFETVVDVTSDDTLDEVVTKINDADLDVTAAVINDGTPGSPYRLSIVSTDPGAAGGFTLSSDGLDLGVVELSEARDAVVFFGGNTGEGLVVTSSTNQLTNIIPGATIDLLAASDQPVTVSIGRDDQATLGSISTFVERFNSTIDQIDTFDSYNAETEERGVLLGDSALITIRNQLYSIVTRRNTDLTGRYTSLAEVGITVGSGGNLQVDESKFQAALADDRDAVLELFTLRETEEDSDGVDQVVRGGIGVNIDELLERLTDPDTGPISVRVDNVERTIELNNQRIEDLNEALARSRARLEREFATLESTLAQLQDQQSSLASLNNLAASS
ncbi:MAG: flagellar filament capping protein FliD [Planctomycetota bacterium]